MYIFIQSYLQNIVKLKSQQMPIKFFDQNGKQIFDDFVFDPVNHLLNPVDQQRESNVQLVRVVDEDGDQIQFRYNFERTGAICRDGSRSFATGRGACSWHGGVAQWLYKKQWYKVAFSGKYKPIEVRVADAKKEVVQKFNITKKGLQLDLKVYQLLLNINNQHQNLLQEVLIIQNALDEQKLKNQQINKKCDQLNKSKQELQKENQKLKLQLQKYKNIVRIVQEAIRIPQADLNRQKQIKPAQPQKLVQKQEKPLNAQGDIQNSKEVIELQSKNNNQDKKEEQEQNCKGQLHQVQVSQQASKLESNAQINQSSSQNNQINQDPDAQQEEWELEYDQEEGSSENQDSEQSDLSLT